MRPLIWSALAVTAAELLIACTASGEPAKVTIDSGTLRGTVQDQVVSFKGVPYAAPPVGPLRWAPPQPAPAWSGERAADAYGPACPQKLKADGKPNGGGVKGAISEDCLSLNIWAPQEAKNAPVMVWVHGGSNISGAGSVGAYDGSAFARDGVVVVTINYRLGALGFFAHPALTRAAGPADPLVSYGLMDQLAALRWVQRNIAAFGGDPARVTLAGESAGGTDVLTLMTLPAARDLFAQAIVESGGGWSQPQTLSGAEAKGEAVAVKAGAPAGATLEQLRALPVQALVAAESRDLDPVVDGRLLTKPPTQELAYGDFPRKPLLIGSNSYEASLMKPFGVTPETVLAEAPDVVKAAYGDIKDDASRAEAIFTDTYMTAPARWIAGRDSRPSFLGGKAGPSRAWLYHFDYVMSVKRGDGKGAGHGFELPFVFDSWSHLGIFGLSFALTAEDRAVTRTVHGCWTAFIKTGVPACDGALAWPAYTQDGQALMDFTATPGLQPHFRKIQLDTLEAQEMKQLGAQK